MENENYTISEHEEELLIIKEQPKDVEEATQDIEEDSIIDYQELIKAIIKSASDKENEEEVIEEIAPVPDVNQDPQQVKVQNDNNEEEVEEVPEEEEVEEINYSQLVYELLQAENGQNKLDTAINDISLTNTLLIILFVLGLAQLAMHIGRGLL